MDSTNAVKKVNDGGSAFPCPIGFAPDESGEYNDAAEGMSLRDYFAAQAIAGAAHSELAADPNWWAVRAYKLADAMLIQRAKGGAS